MTSEASYDYFMKMAVDLAEKALGAGEFPVGCVLEYQGTIIASGRRTGSSGNLPNETDHAEIIALRNLYRIGKQIPGKDITLFCTLEPCLMCFGAVLLSGIRKIVYAYEDVMGGCAHYDLTGASPLYRPDPLIVPNILRNESLRLFKSFFANPDNTYWQGSLLADYTINAGFQPE